ncbi:hypothetical protein [Nonomuraea sp. B19D2]|uniref:hypothetical protein n=1 Tax=Nonomuraea sp. B19D2 TaxID=3159561 RepID=UPI0032DAFE5B
MNRMSLTAPKVRVFPLGLGGILGSQSVMAPESSEVAGRIIGARRRRFDPLPALPVAEVLEGRQRETFHVHPEGILHWTSDSTGALITTADTLVPVPPEYVGRCEKLLAGAWTPIRRDDLADIDQELLDQLMAARLLCTASHEARPTP